MALWLQAIGLVAAIAATGLGFVLLRDSRRQLRELERQVDELEKLIGKPYSGSK